MTVLQSLVVISAILCGRVLPQAITPQQGGNPERTLLSHTLAKEVNLLRYYEGMSIMDDGHGMGKGKGKGNVNDVKCKGHGDPKVCDEPSKKGMAKDKKGKGMQNKEGKGMGMKKGMSKDKDKSEFPSASIVPSQSPPPFVSFVPSLVNQTSVPVNIEDVIQLLSPYNVFYQIEQTRIPSISEYAELATFTDAYLNDYFNSIFAGTTIIFLSSITNITGSEFRLGQPVRVDYNTTMVFGFQSQMIPDLAELDARLASAFEGTNGEAFAAAVAAGVDPANIFSTTSAINFQEAAGVAADIEGARIAMISIISIMSVLAFVGVAVAVAYTVQSEKFEKVSLQTDDSSTDDDSRNDQSTEIENKVPSPKRRVDERGSSARYTNLLQTDAANNMGLESSDMRVASSKYEFRMPDAVEEDADDEH